MITSQNLAVPYVTESPLATPIPTRVARGSNRFFESFTNEGLSLTKKFVELHGGRMGLASEPGKGSTFSFTLPENTSEMS